MRQAAQRSFYAAYDDRYIRVQLFQNACIYSNGVIGTHVGSAICRIGVVAPDAFGCRIMVDHRVHISGRYAKKQTRSTQFFEITQVVPPIGLWHYSYRIPLRLQHSCYNSRTKRRVVYIGIAGEQNDIRTVYSQTV